MAKRMYRAWKLPCAAVLIRRNLLGTLRIASDKDAYLCELSPKEVLKLFRKLSKDYRE